MDKALTTLNALKSIKKNFNNYDTVDDLLDDITDNEDIDAHLTDFENLDLSSADEVESNLESEYCVEPAVGDDPDYIYAYGMAQDVIDSIENGEYTLFIDDYTPYTFDDAEDELNSSIDYLKGLVKND